MRQPAPRQCDLPSWFTNGLQPPFASIQTRAYASSSESVNPSPSPLDRLRLLSCSWQNSRREILEAKSPSLSSTVNVERRGKQGEQYIDRRRRAVQWTWRFAPIPAPVSLWREIWRGCASAVRWPSPGLGNSEIPGQRNGLAQLRPLLHGEQYIDRRRRAVQWTERFAPIPGPVLLSSEIWRVCASAIVGHPLCWAILRLLDK